MDEKALIIKLASEYNLPISKIEEIIYFQFKYVGGVIKAGEFEAIRLPYLGKFHVKPGRVKHLNERFDNTGRD